MKRTANQNPKTRKPEMKKEVETMKPETTATAADRPVSPQLQAIRDRAAHVEIMLSRMSDADRFALIAMLNKAISYHKSGKIEGIFSLDVDCSNCDFCCRMQEAGLLDPCIICGLCYTQSFYQTTHEAHAITGRILSTIELTDAEAACLFFPGNMVRFDCNGELINERHARNLIRIARAHRNITFTIWTKRPDILSAALTAEGGKPENMVIGISSPIINIPFDIARFTFADFVFTVYTEEGMKRALTRGEYPCNGRKCLDCNFRCYRRPESSGPVFIAEKLRRPAKINAAQFAAMVEEIDRKTLKAA